MSNARPITHTFFFMVSLTLLAKVFGFVREMVLANFYGTSYVVDAYVMASAIPGIIFGGIFGAVATAFIPAFSKIKEQHGGEAGDTFTVQVINLLVILSSMAIVFGILFSDQICSIFASGFEGETARLTSFYIKITFAYVIFTSPAGILDAYMQYKGFYLKPIVSGYIQNIAIISVIVISAIFSHYYLAFGMLIGAMLRFLYMWYNVNIIGLYYKSDFHLNDSIGKIIKLAIPVFIGTYILQINTFVDKTLASNLPEGSVAALNYGMILITLITGLTVALLVTLIYPKIAKAYTIENWYDFNFIVEKGVRITAIITIPFSLGILAFSDEVVQIIYERGQFSPSATALTSGAFFFYGFGLIFFAFNDLVTKVFYSMRNTKAPIICSIISVMLNIVLNLILVRTMAHLGLALATSLSAMANSLCLCIWMSRKYPQVQLFKSRRKYFFIIFSAILSVSVAYIIYQFIVSTIWMPRIFYLLTSVSSGICIYIALLYTLRIEEIKLFISRLKFKKQN